MAVDQLAKKVDAVPLPEELSSAISRIVRTRRAEAGQSDVQRHKTRRRNLELFRRQAIFLMKISIYVGPRSVSIGYDELGLPDEVVDALKESGASRPSVPIFEDLNKQANKMEGLKKKLYKRYFLYSEPFWYYSERDEEAVAAGTEEMKRELVELKQFALSRYDDNFQLYLNGISRILYAAKNAEDKRYEEAKNAQKQLRTAGKTAEANLIEVPEPRLTEEKIQQLLEEKYAPRFPSQERVERSFRIVIEYGGRVPSILEQLQDDAEMAEAVARRERADLDAEATLTERQFKEEFYRSVRDSYQDALSSARQEIIQLVGENLQVLEQMQVEDVQTQTKRKIRDNLGRLQTLLDHDASLEEMVNELTEVQFQVKQQSGTTAFSRKLVELREKLDLAQSSGAGRQMKAAQGMLF